MVYEGMDGPWFFGIFMSIRKIFFPNICSKIFLTTIFMIQIDLLGNIFDKNIFSNFFLAKIFWTKICLAKIFLAKIFLVTVKIFLEKIFWVKIFLVKIFLALPLLSLAQHTTITSSHHPHQWFLKMSVTDGRRTNLRTGRTHVLSLLLY